MAIKRQVIKSPQPPLAESPERRAAVFRELCQHVIAGYSVECFGALSPASVKDCFEKYPEEFDREEYEQAIRDGQLGWEKIGRQQATGSCVGNSRSWYYNMANRYGWSDRQRVETEHKGGSGSIDSELCHCQDC